MSVFDELREKVEAIRKTAKYLEDRIQYAEYDKALCLVAGVVAELRRLEDAITEAEQAEESKRGPDVEEAALRIKREVLVWDAEKKELSWNDRLLHTILTKLLEGSR